MEQAARTMVKLASKYMTYGEISAIIKKKHNIKISSNAIRKRLKRQGFPSRRGPTNHSANEVKLRIQSLLPTIPHTIGYRQMTDILRQKGIHVRRDRVMHILREIDAPGVEHRRRRRIQRKIYRTLGSNHVWHIDGYDKLKPFGFAIHGCIDGYSRKILWLSAGPSNNDPSLMAHHFVSCVDKLKGCPLVLQSDPGTENYIMGALQCLFRHDGSDCFSGIHSFRVVKSVFNQRIEAWWSMMRRQQSDWWISFFKDMDSFGLFHKGNENDIRCIRYCFLPVLQNDLDCLLDRWNNHYISHNRRSACPNGRPSVLHLTPDEKGFRQCLQPVRQDHLLFAYSKCRIGNRSGCGEFYIRASNVFRGKGWTHAKNCEEALHQYLID